MEQVKTTTPFKVVARSSNTNSFGLYGIVMVAQNGMAFQAAANSLNAPKRDAIVHIPTTITFEKMRGPKINLCFASAGFEIPEKLPICPPEAVNEIWN